MTILNDISVSVQSGSTGQTEELVAQALKENCQPAKILREGLVAGVLEMERKFYSGEVLASEVLIAERTMKAGLQILTPALENEQSPPVGTVITGTLEGDIRETEKDIISVLMQSLGLRVIDLGTSVSSVRFIETAVEEKAQIIVCSTMLTTFLPQMKSLVQAASQADIRGKTKILLSGGPVSEWFCKSIEADMYAPDPIQAAEMAAEHCRKIHLKFCPKTPIENHERKTE